MTAPDPFDIVTMQASLEKKLAAMIWYLQEVRAGRRTSDPHAFESWLDDKEVTDWLDKAIIAGKVSNTRFIGK